MAWGCAAPMPKVLMGNPLFLSFLQALEGEVAELRAAAAENEESLGDCLTSLGQEEAKVRLTHP